MHFYKTTVFCAFYLASRFLWKWIVFVRGKRQRGKIHNGMCIAPMLWLKSASTDHRHRGHTMCMYASAATQVLQQSSLKEGCCISGSCGRQHIFGSTIWSVSHQNEMAIDHFWCQGNYLNADKQQYECKTLKYKTKKSLRQLRSKTGGSLGENDNFPVMPGHLPFLENCHLATLLSKIWLYNWR